MLRKTLRNYKGEIFWTKKSKQLRTLTDGNKRLQEHESMMKYCKTPGASLYICGQQREGKRVSIITANEVAVFLETLTKLLNYNRGDFC